jgi:hypothetical protein
VTTDYTAALALLTDAELDAMTRRAYAGAAAAWSELRRYRPAGAVTPDDFRTCRAMLAADAEHLDAWYADLRAERDRRAQDAEP